MQSARRSHREGGAHEDHHYYSWIVAFEEKPMTMIKIIVGFSLFCFVFAGLGVLVGGSWSLDPRFRDVVPVYLRDHIAKKRQDAASRMSALSVKGAAGLRGVEPREREVRYYYLHIIYQTKRGDNIWQTKYLQKIKEVEEKVLHQKARHWWDGEDYSYKDFCLKSYPNQQVLKQRYPGQNLSLLPCKGVECCFFPISPLGFLSDKWLPLTDPAPFQLFSQKRTGYFYVNLNSPDWMKEPCKMPEGDRDVSELGSFVRFFIKAFEKKELSEHAAWLCGPGGIEKGFNCKCLAPAYNALQLAKQWGFPLQNQWNMSGVDVSQEKISDVSKYWASYEDDTVERRQVREQNNDKPVNKGEIRQDSDWWNQDDLPDSLRSKRALLQGISPFVIGNPVPLYIATASTPASCTHSPDGARRRRDSGRCTCRRRWSAGYLSDGKKHLEPGFECRGTEIVYTGRDAHEKALKPMKLPNLMSIVADDSYGTCLEKVHYRGKEVCQRRKESAKALHSLFFFGHPLKNINPEWTATVPGPEFTKSSKFLMDWVFTAYNGLLMELNKEANKIGLSISFDANNFDNSDPLLMRYIEYMMPADALYIILGIGYVFVYCRVMMGSTFMVIMSLGLIVLAFGPSLLMYQFLFQQQYFGLLHMNAIFILLGIGADNIFVILDAYDQSKAEALANGEPTQFRYTMSHAVGHASRACMCTSSTTFFAFCANGTSAFPAVKTFGLFCGALVLVNFVFDFTLFVAVLGQREVYAAQAKAKKEAEEGAAAAQDGAASPTAQSQLSNQPAPQRAAVSSSSSVSGAASNISRAREESGQKLAEKRESEAPKLGLLSADDIMDASEERARIGDSDGEAEQRSNYSSKVEAKLSGAELFFNQTFFNNVYAARYLLLVVWVAESVFCCWRAWQLAPDSNMPNPFPKQDNYARFLPAVAENWDRSFNPFRLKAKIVLGVNDQDPIDRGATRDYQDCFFDCQGQTPNYVDVMGLFERPDTRAVQLDFQRRVKALCDELQRIADKPEAERTPREARLRIAGDEEIKFARKVSCPITDFETWLTHRRAQNEAQSVTSKNMYQWPSSNFCCQRSSESEEISEFLEFMLAPCNEENPNCKPAQTNADALENQVFFNLDSNQEPVLRGMVVEVVLDFSWQDRYENGTRLYEEWENLMSNFKKINETIPTRDIQMIRVHGHVIKDDGPVLAVNRSDVLPSEEVFLTTGLRLQKGDIFEISMTPASEGKQHVPEPTWDRYKFVGLLDKRMLDPLHLRGIPREQQREWWIDHKEDVLWEVARPDDEPRYPVQQAAYVTDLFGFHYYFLQAAMIDECYTGIFFSLGMAFIVLLIATQNVVVATLAICCISNIISSVLAFGVSMGWNLGVIEAIIYVMVIGLSVDYVVHLADAFLECPAPSSKERARFMVTRMGKSVLSGALTSLGLGGVMLCCYSLFLVKFGAVIFFVVCKAVVGSLVFFTVMLCTFGPSGKCGSLGCCGLKSMLTGGGGARTPSVAEEEAAKGPPGFRRYRSSMLEMGADGSQVYAAEARRQQPGTAPRQSVVEVELSFMRGQRDADSFATSASHRR